MELSVALSDQNEEVRAAALEALHKMGTVTWLENGSAIVTRDSAIIGFVAGTTAEDAAEPRKVAVFEVQGARHTNYLRTAVGDVYQDGQWRLQDNTYHDYNEGRTLPSVSGVATHSQEIFLSLAEADQDIPRGVVPISQRMEVRGRGRTLLAQEHSLRHRRAHEHLRLVLHRRKLLAGRNCMVRGGCRPASTRRIQACRSGPPGSGL